MCRSSIATGVVLALVVCGCSGSDPDSAKDALRASRHDPIMLLRPPGTRSIQSDLAELDCDDSGGGSPFVARTYVIRGDPVRALESYLDPARRSGWILTSDRTANRPIDEHEAQLTWRKTVDGEDLVAGARVHHFQKAQVLAVGISSSIRCDR